MRILVQRVSKAEVEVAGSAVASIGSGLLIFAAVHRADNLQIVQDMAQKTLHLRLFADERGKMNHSAVQTDAELLAVPQFTLCANTEQGHRPGFQDCAPPEQAEMLFQEFVTDLGKSGLRTAAGVFGADMNVYLCNQGPVTFILDNTTIS